MIRSGVPCKALRSEGAAASGSRTSTRVPSSCTLTIVSVPLGGGDLTGERAARAVRPRSQPCPGRGRGGDWPAPSLAKRPVHRPCAVPSSVGNAGAIVRTTRERGVDSGRSVNSDARPQLDSPAPVFTENYRIERTFEIRGRNATARSGHCARNVPTRNVSRRALEQVVSPNDQTARSLESLTPYQAETSRCPSRRHIACTRSDIAALFWRSESVL
jgi:hypothetical protein